MPEQAMTIQQFGASVKVKYPAYGQYSDEDIGRRMLDKYPVYRSRVSDTGQPFGAPSAFTPQAPAVSAARQKDIEAQRQTGALLAPNTESPNIVTEPLKVAVNLPGSAWNFAKGVLKAFNPVETVKKVGQAAGEFKALAQEAGGYGKAAKALVSGLPGATYESLVPEFGKGIVTAAGGAVSGDRQKVGEGIERAQRAVVTDPVGSIAPFLIAGKVAAGKAGYGKQFDAAVSKTAQVVTRPISATAGAARNLVTGGTKFAVGQATGLQPETIGQITETPRAFSKSARASVDRASLGRDVQSALGRRADVLSETGEAYAPVRESAVPVRVSKTWLDTTIKELTGLDIKKGRLSTSGAAKLRDATDVRAMQYLYDTWKPIFNKGSMTANEFLNFRTDLTKLSRFERQIGKSQPLESAAKLTRGRLNEAYRPQLEGLEKIDAEFGVQSAELKRLSKGLVDRSGNLTDAAINRIANATGKGKDLLLNRLEETVPGITQRIRVLKAVEDIQHASGIKVGTYTRAAITGSAFFLGGLPQAVLAAILTSPELAVPMLRSYGLLKNSAVVSTVVNALKTGAKTVNELPGKPPAVLNREVNAKNFPVGLTIEDVSKSMQPFVENTRGMKLHDARAVFERLKKNGSAVVAEKPGMRLVLKDEGEFVKLGLDTGKLTPTDVKLPERNFATAEEAVLALKPLYERALGEGTQQKLKTNFGR